jgi:hypothetical protein
MQYLLWFRFVVITARLSAALLLAFTLMSCNTGEPASSTQTQEETAMETLQIDLQEGFANDQVIIKVNDQEIFRESVTTNLMHGFAASMETQVPRGFTTIDVQVPTKGLSKTILVDMTRILHVGIAIRDGIIEYRVSDEPFPYF